jgi:hypothetical protein
LGGNFFAGFVAYIKAFSEERFYDFLKKFVEMFFLVNKLAFIQFFFDQKLIDIYNRRKKL